MVIEVVDIVKEYLEKNGYDGLVNDYEDCGCELVDLAPCLNNISRCRPGYKTLCRCGDGHDFHISMNPPRLDKRKHNPDSWTECENCGLIHDPKMTKCSTALTVDGHQNRQELKWETQRALPCDYGVGDYVVSGQEKEEDEE